MVYFPNSKLTPLTRRYVPTSGKPSSGPLRPRTEALSWLKARMASQGRDGIGETYQYVPAYAGLRRCYSCTICNYIMPPYMRYAHMKTNSPHQTVFGSSVRHSTSARVFSSAHQWHTFCPYLSGIIAHTSLSSMG